MPGGHDGPRRGRMALAALAAAGLVGGGLVVAGQFASADRPSLEAGASSGDDTTTTDENVEPTEPSGDRDDDGPSIDGEIVIDDGDGEPVVIDLGDLESRIADIGECLGGPIFRGGPLFDGDAPLFGDDFEQRMEAFLDELPWDELDGLDLEELDDGVRIFGSGGSTVTVVGPDGVEVIDLGEGDATVTIEQTDGELSIETDGDATVAELPDFGRIFGGGPGHHAPGDPSMHGDLDLGNLDLDDLDLDDLDLGELDLGTILPFDLDDLDACLDDLD